MEQQTGRRRLLSPLLLGLLVAAGPLQAEDAPAPTIDETPVATVEASPPSPVRASLPAPPVNEGLLARLSAENVLLKQQLQQARQQTEQWLIDPQQRWFVIGAAVSLASFLAGLFVARGRKPRPWLN